MAISRELVFDGLTVLPRRPGKLTAITSLAFVASDAVGIGTAEQHLSMELRHRHAGR
jgi:hypothetical protein